MFNVFQTIWIYMACESAIPSSTGPLLFHAAEVSCPCAGRDRSAFTGAVGRADSYAWYVLSGWNKSSSQFSTCTTSWPRHQLEVQHILGGNALTQMPGIKISQASGLQDIHRLGKSVFQHPTAPHAISQPSVTIPPKKNCFLGLQPNMSLGTSTDGGRWGDHIRRKGLQDHQHQQIQHLHPFVALFQSLEKKKKKQVDHLTQRFGTF